MATIKSDQPLVPSVLDRLIDDDPGMGVEAPKSRSQVLAELRQSVRRDLENLLNTRWCYGAWPPELSELDRSLVSYGTPDTSATDLGSSPGRAAFLREVRRIIRTFEPRLTSVSIKQLENIDFADRTLRFRIDGMLHAYPAPEPVVFDSALEPATGEFEVRSGLR